MRWYQGAPSDPSLLDQLLEVCAVVEPGAAHMAAECATESDLAKLDATLKAMEGAVDIDAAVSADNAFHCHLLLATHNELLAQLAQIIAIGMAKHQRFAHHANPSELAASHRAVLDAMQARDPDAAERAMRAVVDQCTTKLKTKSNGHRHS
jgi:DNA-binding FadR family transcriptional regulator